MTAGIQQLGVLRELIVDVNDEDRRFVWSAQSELLTHHNGSTQIIKGEDGQTKVVWIADLLPDEAAGPIGQMMEQGQAYARSSPTRLDQKIWSCLCMTEEGSSYASSRNIELHRCTQIDQTFTRNSGSGGRLWLAGWKLGTRLPPIRARIRIHQRRGALRMGPGRASRPGRLDHAEPIRQRLDLRPHEEHVRHNLARVGFIYRSMENQLAKPGS
jgi:hypothetical protein